VHRDIERFEKELRQGVQFAFFPEGSSFDGSFLRPFKSSLFESAIRTNTNIQPVCLRYLSLDNEPLSLRNRDRVFYHGDMQLIPQLLGILKIKSLRVELVYCPVIEVKGKNRKELANLAFSSIEKHFLPVTA
jgi:1-acyl-sn-glycerol-3-phosphate acyltransferase